MIYVMAAFVFLFVIFLFWGWFPYNKVKMIFYQQCNIYDYDNCKC